MPELNVLVCVSLRVFSSTPSANRRTPLRPASCLPPVGVDVMATTHATRQRRARQATVRLGSLHGSTARTDGVRRVQPRPDGNPAWRDVSPVWLGVVVHRFRF
jgi:hypothetical protein